MTAITADEMNRHSLLGDCLLWQFWSKLQLLQFENDTISNWNFNISSILSVKPLHVEFLYDYSILMEFGWHKHLFSQKMKSYQKTKQKKQKTLQDRKVMSLFMYAFKNKMNLVFCFLILHKQMFMLWNCYLSVPNDLAAFKYNTVVSIYGVQNKNIKPATT